jgi:GntR family transcriptional regulator/MocR family aminotransferase
MLKASMSNGQSWLEQRALAEFINDGHFDRHVRKLRQIYQSRRDSLVAALRKHFGNPEITGQGSGLHFVWRLPEGVPSARDIQLRAREQGVGVYAFSSGAGFDFDGAAPDNALVLGYSSLTEKEIGQVIKKLHDIMSERDTPAIAPREKSPRSSSSKVAPSASV